VPTGNVERQAAGVLRELERHGLLLETDAKLPSLVALVAGGPVKGSWWGHPLGHTIFATGESLFAHRDVLLVKLVSGKATWVHRRLWPALLGVARAREPWQLEGLSTEARELLASIDRDGEARATGAVALGLETRLLARGEQAHTASGRHAKVLESWDRWAARMRPSVSPLAPEAGRQELERVLEALNARHGGRGRLPWQRPGGRRGAPG
jgi:hypothetical protein